MDPIVCSSCGARFPVNGLAEDDSRALEDLHHSREFAEELRMLLKVKEFYRRHKEAEGRIRPHFMRVLESKDPGVRERLCAGVPFDQIDLPPESLPVAWVEREEDREVVEYLQDHEFALGRRLEFVSGELGRLKGSVRAVPCPRCQEGRLHIPPGEWDNFITAGDSITWYWPGWGGFDTHGVLHVKASGWQGRSHWTGEIAIEPEKPEYEFWCWFVAQKEYHRLVEEKELPAIREDWARRKIS
jgi:hypothetical protein